MRPKSPGPLGPRDRVAVFAVAGTWLPEHLSLGLAWLSARGLEVEGPGERTFTGYLAAPDAQRAEELTLALADPGVRALLAVRGGYGATRVLEHAGEAILASLARDPKPVVGYSDLTALHAAWARAGVRSVHGLMATAVAKPEHARDAEAMVAVLKGELPPAWEGLEVWSEGAGPGAREVTGRAAGGNLSLLAALAGTPWAPDLEGSVLFLEDVTERPYRVDRMLTTLRLAGALRGVRAVVLGDFDQCDPAPDGVTVEEVLRDRLLDLGVPVLSRAPFGHASRNRPIVLGAPVTVSLEGAVRHREGLWP